MRITHFILENTKATALPLANYPSLYWIIQSLPLYLLQIIPLYIGEYIGYRFTNCELSHFILENKKATALQLPNYPTFYWRIQTLTFTTCELFHFILENTKATALPLVNYPTLYWRIQRLPLYNFQIIPHSVGEYKGYRFTTCE